MEYFKPSSKRPNFLILSLLSILSGTIAGFIGVGVISTIIDEMRNSSIKYSGFKGIAVNIVMIPLILLIVTPILMGFVCSRGASFRSQNPKVSGLFSLGSALLALAFIVYFVPKELGLTLWQWANLNFKKLPQSGIDPKLFLNLIPILILFISSHGFSTGRTKRPICNKHKKRYKQELSLKIPGLQKDTAIEKILERESFDNYIQASDYSLAGEDHWGEVSACFCPYCDQDGYLSIVFRRVPDRNAADKTFEHKELCSMAKINQNQVKSIKRIIAEGEKRAAKKK